MIHQHIHLVDLLKLLIKQLSHLIQLSQAFPFCRYQCRSSLPYQGCLLLQYKLAPSVYRENKLRQKSPRE
ncbi:hypothetical protein SAL_1307 [Streptococcus agalactiae 515]|nr:hypothetical protein SAL_1307 [Streptococcus agalactiae 515]